MKLSVCLFLLALALPSFAEEGVVVVLTNGNTVGFAFSEKPVITTGENLLLSTRSGKQVSYDYSNVRKVFWGGDFATAIEKVKSKNSQLVKFKINGNNIEALGLPRGERVAVYTVNGSLVTSETSTSDNSIVTLHLPYNQHAVYIIRTSTGVSYKFINR